MANVSADEASKDQRWLRIPAGIDESIRYQITSKKLFLREFENLFDLEVATVAHERGYSKDWDTIPTAHR